MTYKHFLMATSGPKMQACTRHTCDAHVACLLPHILKQEAEGALLPKKKLKLCTTLHKSCTVSHCKVGLINVHLRLPLLCSICTVIAVQSRLGA
jgi:hypothetical protein